MEATNGAAESNSQVPSSASRAAAQPLEITQPGEVERGWRVSLETGQVSSAACGGLTKCVHCEKLGASNCSRLPD